MSHEALVMVPQEREGTLSKEEAERMLDLTEHLMNRADRARHATRLVMKKYGISN